MSYLVALFKSLSLMLLSGIPYVVYRWAKINRPPRTGILTGATFGLVVSPVSLGLYLLGFLLPLIGNASRVSRTSAHDVSRSPSISAVNTFWVRGTWCRSRWQSLPLATLIGDMFLGYYLRSYRIYF
jgi:hypothetical protein